MPPNPAGKVPLAIYPFNVTLKYSGKVLLFYNTISRKLTIIFIVLNMMD